MKVVYNDGSVVLDLEVSAFGFLALLVRVHRWHQADPGFLGVLVTIEGDTVLLRLHRQ